MFVDNPLVSDLLNAIVKRVMARKARAEAYELYRSGGLWSFYAAAIRDVEQADQVYDGALDALERAVTVA